MEEILSKSAMAAAIGGLFYICWYILPQIKQRLVAKGEEKLRQKGCENTYKKIHKIIKTVLYIILALMLILPIVFLLTLALKG